MKARLGLLVLICGLGVSPLGGGFALAQEHEVTQEVREETPPTDESNEPAEAKKPEAEEPFPALQTGRNETVTVTATRVETDLMKTPVAVSVFDQETLDREGVQNVRDLAQLVPNMDIATKNGQSTPMISLRGVRSTNETELGDPSVGVHLDGIYSPRMQGILGLMFDNERVEVLRGPQGTLFGRNSTVGNISIISAKPKVDAFDASIFLQYGNFNAPELQGMVNVPVSETFALRFAGRYFQRDSYVTGYWDPNQYDQRFIQGLTEGAPIIAPNSDACTGPECSTRTQNENWFSDFGDVPIRALVPADDDDFYFNAKEWAYRISGRWQPNRNDMSLNLSFQHYRSDSAGGLDLVNCDKLRGRPVYLLDDDNEIVFENGEPVITGTNDCSNIFPEDDTFQAVVNVPGRLFLDIKYLRSEYNWDIKNNLRLVVLAGGEIQDRESTQDMEQSLNAWDQAMVFLPGTGSESWMGEVQLQSYGNRRLNGIVGLNYFHETTSTFGFFDNPINPKDRWDQPDRSTDAAALFAQGTYSFSPKWHLTLGGRYSDETKEDKGGRTYQCDINATFPDGCSPDGLDVVAVDAGLLGFDRDDLSSLPLSFFADIEQYPTFTPNDNKGTWSHFDWRIGLDYQRNENTLLYGYLATGFKSGGIGDVFVGDIETGVRDENGDPVLNDFGIPLSTLDETTVRTEFDPEEVITLELGWKQRFLDGKLELRGAYFFSDYENMQYASVGSLAFTESWEQLLDANGDPIDDNDDGVPDRAWVGKPLFVAYFTQNVPGAQIQGIELEYHSRPWQGGRIFGYASWLDTEITDDWITKWDYDPVTYFAIDFAESVDAANEVLTVNLKGNDLAVSPPFKLRMTVDHAFLVKSMGLTIIPWVTGFWEADSYLTIWNVDRHTEDLDFVIRDEDIRYTDDKREAWSMLHAGLRMHWGQGWMAELFGYNLTNEVVQYWGGAAERVPKGSMSTPTTYGFRMQYQF